MKKFGIILVIMFCIFSILPGETIQAAGFSTSISGPGTISAGQTFSVDLRASSSVPLYGIEGSFSYDTGKLQLVSSTGKNGYTLTQGSKVVVDAASPKSGSFTFATVTFKAKSGFTIGSSAKVSMGGVIGSDGSATLSGSGSSKTVSMPVPKSSNNYLASLSVSPKGISFDKNKTSYTVVVDNNVTSAAIKASAADPKASVSGTGTKSLKVYENRFNVTVTAENGSKRTYSINIVRRDEDGNAGALSKNNNLKSLGVEGYPLEFKADVLDYILDVDNLITDVEISAEVADGKASMEIKKTTPFVVGENVVEVVVTSESGDNKTYVIRINRSGSAPTVPMAGLMEALGKVTSEEIAVISDETGVLTTEMLTALKDSGKTLIVKGRDESGKSLYEWTLNCGALQGGETLRTRVSFTSPNGAMMDAASNYAKGWILSFEDNETLPEGTRFQLFTGDGYQDGDLLRLYYFNEETQKLELVQEDLVVTDGAVVFPLEHTSDYLLTASKVPLEEEGGINIWILLAGLELMVILILGGLLLKNNKIKA
ncbi:cadherin-like beta sandwich domain-containing protein [Alkalibacter rhizosphaerae]|uniref:Cadherin-like beta sandwich domain-containing protein n=1 Tax=Alkalibacter rhizosphaerae TaxID=2815577 RepID=A0A975AIA3_9FIRM|nr:cadherin-like beta sandwich domain-containing protein [Alkalibacter rhizosphaerae]QSX09262.1 cadherin-like beta sandwich domain-containing protein [Alkalibacter rhizosphaerae]